MGLSPRRGDCYATLTRGKIWTLRTIILHVSLDSLSVLHVLGRAARTRPFTLRLPYSTDSKGLGYFQLVAYTSATAAPALYPGCITMPAAPLKP